MRHHHAAAAVLLSAGLTLAGCSTSSSHDTPATSAPAAATEQPLPTGDQYATGKTAACWRAIRDQYAPGTVQLTGAPTTPPQCAGLTADEISSVASDVLAHQLG